MEPSKMLPPLAPAEEHLEGFEYGPGDWAFLEIASQETRSVIVAFRSEGQTRPLMLVIHEEPRRSRRRRKTRLTAFTHPSHKMISIEWIPVEYAKRFEKGIEAELLTHTNPTIRDYFKQVHTNNGKLVIQESR